VDYVLSQAELNSLMLRVGNQTNQCLCEQNEKLNILMEKIFNLGCILVICVIFFVIIAFAALVIFTRSRSRSHSHSHSHSRSRSQNQGRKSTSSHTPSNEDGEEMKSLSQSKENVV
jgi:ABC-type uncharacterized transport system permease subunit